MRTILIMLSRGIVARNILRTGVLDILLSDPDVRLVVLVPPNIPDYFRKDFDHPRVILEESEEVRYGLFHRKVFAPVYQKLVYTETAKFFMRYGGRIPKGNKSPVAAFFGHIGASIISRMPFLKPIFRELEFHLFPYHGFDRFFEKYKPDLVVSTIVKSKRDIAILKAAKRFGVPHISMARSWDNLDRILIAVRPQKIIVQNEVMRELAETLHGIPKEDAFVSGFPQFDLYNDRSLLMSRADFLASLGLDPARKVIFFASEGVWAPHGDHVVAALIARMRGGGFAEPVSLIVRPHYSDRADDGSSRYDRFVGEPDVFVDRNQRMLRFFVDKWDASRTEMVHLMNELAHASVLVTYATTMAIEAAIFDTPVVNVAFRLPGEPKDGPFFGMFYGSSHYSNVVRTGGVRLATSEEELVRYVDEALLHPETLRAERRVIVERLAYGNDGKSGERVGRFILTCLRELPFRRVIA